MPEVCETQSNHQHQKQKQKPKLKHTSFLLVIKKILGYGNQKNKFDAIKAHTQLYCIMLLQVYNDYGTCNCHM